MTGFLARMVLRSLAARFRRGLVTLAAVTVAVAALVVLDALMIGVGDTMVRNTVALGTGHVLLRDNFGADPAAVERAAKDTPGVVAALPRRHADAVRQESGVTTTWTVIGVRPELERGRSAPAAKVVRGVFLDAPGTIALGAGLARKLGANVGDDLAFTVGGRPRAFRVGGVYRTGVDYLDGAAFVHLSDLDGPIDEVALFVDDPENDDLCRGAGHLFGLAPSGGNFRTWRDLLPELVQILDLNRVSMDIVLVLATIILAMGVSNTMFISVSERTREFGILKAMGMPPTTVMLLVTAEAAGLAVLGALAGLALGAAAVAVWAHFGLDLGQWTSANPHFLVSGVVIPRLAARGLALPGLLAFALAMLAALAPAMRAARVRVVEALRWI